MKNVITFILVLLALSGCGATSLQTSGGTYQEDFDALKTVKAQDEISQSEAYTIAKAFFGPIFQVVGSPMNRVAKMTFG